MQKPVAQRIANSVPSNVPSHSFGSFFAWAVFTAAKASVATTSTAINVDVRMVAAMNTD